MTASIAKGRHDISMYEEHEDEDDCLVICGSETEDEEICKTPLMGIENPSEDEDDSRDEIYSLRDFRIDATKLSLFQNISSDPGTESRGKFSLSADNIDSGNDHSSVSKLIIVDENRHGNHDFVEATHKSPSDDDGVITIDDSDNEGNWSLCANTSSNGEERACCNYERGMEDVTESDVTCQGPRVFQTLSLAGLDVSEVVVIDSEEESNHRPKSSKKEPGKGKKKSKVAAKKKKTNPREPGGKQRVSSEGADTDNQNAESSDTDSEFDRERCRPRSFTCIYCSYETIVEEWYHDHLTAHVPEYRNQRKYCPDCSYSAGNVKYVLFHMKRVHDIEEPQFYRIGEKRYACLLCRKSTELRIDIEAHIEGHLEAKVVNVERMKKREDRKEKKRVEEKREKRKYTKRNQKKTIQTPS